MPEYLRLFEAGAGQNPGNAAQAAGAGLGAASAGGAATLGLSGGNGRIVISWSD